MHKRGQIYIGTVISIGIFFILSQAVVTLIFSAYDLISYSRARITARHIASENMEIIRNFPYDEIGTLGGIPPGNINQEENVLKNGLGYIVNTSVIYIDDSFDNTSPTDTSPNDYKRIRIEVSWGGLTATRSNTVVLISDITPKGMEASTAGGVLSVLVFNANTEPVPQANVNIVSNSTSPPININYVTDNFGRIILPGAPECNNCYEITVTKDGYSTEKTYSTDEIANPAKPYVSVLENELTEVSFAIDELGTLNIATTGAQTIHLQGSKILGTDTLDLPVFKYDEDITTDSAGNITLEDMEWDNYLITPSIGKVISGTNPLNPFSILPGTTTDLLISLANDTGDSLFTVFTDSSGTPIASVSATISTVTPEFSEELISGDANDPNYGQVFFDNLTPETYQLTATASGFVNYSNDVDINGYTLEQINLVSE